MSREHDDDLVARLRALPAERTLPADGWMRVRNALPPRGDSASACGDAAVSARTLTAHAAGAAPELTRVPRRRRRLWPAAGALAACLALAWVAPWAPSPQPAAQHRAAAAGDLPAQAQVLVAEYDQAVAALPARSAAEWQPALAELDRSAEQIRQALAESPRSLYLLEQLQRTYTLRLELTRQAALAAPGLAT